MEFEDGADDAVSDADFSPGVGVLRGTDFLVGVVVISVAGTSDWREASDVAVVPTAGGLIVRKPTKATTGSSRSVLVFIYLPAF